jgi:hypothetical protein
MNMELRKYGGQKLMEALRQSFNNIWKKGKELGSGKLP